MLFMSGFNQNNQHMLSYFVSCSKKIFYKRLLGSSIYVARNLSTAFRYCCSLCISTILFESSIRLLAYFKISVCPDRFNPSKVSNLVQIGSFFDGFVDYFIHLVNRQSPPPSQRVVMVKEDFNFYPQLLEGFL